VIDSVKYGPQTSNAIVGVQIEVERGSIRVTDTSTGRPTLKIPRA
jgi:hypothetical protein